jgi:hypothetical protein
MKTFNDWYNLIQEGMAEPSAEVSEPTVATVDQTTANTQSSTSNRDVIINDVDSIMTSLETLSSELKESLKLHESDLASMGVAAAGVAAVAGLAKGAKMLYDAKVKAPKARKEQAKVNAMNIKIAGVESTISSADTEQKEKLKNKLEAVKSSRDDLQKAIEDQYSDSSNVVKRSIAAEKTKGKMEVLKVHMNDASPEQQKEIKNQLAKLKIKSSEDTQLLQQSVEDVKNNTTPEDQAAVKDLGKDNADDTTKKEREDKNTKAGKLARLNDLMKKAKESGDESKIKKVQDLIDKVSAKEAWQIEGTNLGMILESEITTLEMSFKLNESKYITNSIKDRFFKLL